MNSWKRASRDMVRIFFSHDQHIAVVLGRKPRQCSQIELVDTTKRPKMPILSVQCTCNEISNHASNRGLDTYCLVKPVFAGPRKQYINLLHQDGSEPVPVESISDSVSTRQGAKPNILDEPQVTSSPEMIASAMGFSPNFSLDEAFNDALGKLRLNTVSVTTSNEPSMVDVVAMGTMYGGFSGYSRLFVRVEQSKLLDLTGASRRQASTRRNEKLR